MYCLNQFLQYSSSYKIIRICIYMKQGNYLRLLGNDMVATILDNVADLYEEDILLIEKKINKIKNKMGLYHNNKRLYRIWFRFFG